MKFAFCVKTKTWFASGPRGWTNAKGEMRLLSASPKATKFYKDEATALADGMPRSAKGSTPGEKSAIPGEKSAPSP